jgi:hypothetical protein
MVKKIIFQFHRIKTIFFFNRVGALPVALLSRSWCHMKGNRLKLPLIYSNPSTRMVPEELERFKRKISKNSKKSSKITFFKKSVGNVPGCFFKRFSQGDPKID